MAGAAYIVDVERITPMKNITFGIISILLMLRLRS
jgi:hypothetical protein